MVYATKIKKSKHVQWVSPCQKLYELRKHKDKTKNRPTQFKAKTSISNTTNGDNTLNPKSDRGEERVRERKERGETVQNPEIDNENEHRHNSNNIKDIKKMASNITYRRTFSKYNDVRRKFKAKFKSTYTNSGKFDEGSTKYKAYINNARNKKIKLLLKYSICSIRYSNKNKRYGCAQLPGKGTYNHRFAYDEALKLYRMGKDINVLYKVTDKTNSVYVINGQFSMGKKKIIVSHSNIYNTHNKKQNKLEETELKYKDLKNIDLKHKDLKNKDLKNEDLQNEELSASVILETEEWHKEFARLQEEKKNKKNLYQLKMEEKLKQEKMEIHEHNMRLKEMREKDKLFRAEMLGQLSELGHSPNNIPGTDDKNNEINKKANEKLEKSNAEKQLDIKLNIMHENEERQRLKRLKIQQNIESYRKIKNINEILKIKPQNICDRRKVITDVNDLNDIERWILQEEETASGLSWLKIVTCRIDSLGRQVDELFKSKCMRKAMDKVIDLMTGKKLSQNSYRCYKKPLCNKTTKRCSSFVINTKRSNRTTRYRTMAFGIHKSTKFTNNPSCRRMYNVMKTKGSYFRVVNMDTCGSRRCCTECRN